MILQFKNKSFQNKLSFDDLQYSHKHKLNLMKYPFYLHIITFILLISLTTCIEVRVSVPQMPGSSQQLQDRANLKLSINSADRFIYPDNKNTFTLPNLVTARNMIEVVSDIYMYPILMIDQRPEQQRKFSLLHPGTRQIIKTVQHPIVLQPIERIIYFQPEGGFSIKSVIFSGYGMMIGFGILLYLCYQNIMPKLEQAQEAPAA